MVESRSVIRRKRIMELEEGRPFFVKFIGTKDRLVWVNISGTEYVYERDPTSLFSLKEIVSEFLKTLKKGKAGKALAFLKKNTIMRGKKIKESQIAKKLIKERLEIIAEAKGYTLNY